ncbi:MAG TPA: dihydrodipicolinate synthase family protein [Gemmataceae bacterium]|jgi:N-acetylneuraminate lyase
MTAKLHGLVAATHTPFDADGRLNLAAVEAQAGHLIRTGVTTAFVGGSTGECHSLTVEERLALADRWTAVARGTPLRIVVHVGGNCLADARTLAAHAQSVGAMAIAALAPSYFKPATVNDLVTCCADIAGAAPGLPFYFYDIPSMTSVRLPMPEFLTVAAGLIPTFAGIKFTNPDLMAYLQCLRIWNGWCDVPWGIDEWLLAALAVGAVGVVGSSYNFAAPVYRRLMAAFAAGDLTAARREQFRSVQLIEVLSGFGYMAAAKAAMGFLGVDVGPPRLPFAPLTGESRDGLRAELERMGFFDWVRPSN